MFTVDARSSQIFTLLLWCPFLSISPSSSSFSTSPSPPLYLLMGVAQRAEGCAESAVSSQQSAVRRGSWPMGIQSPPPLDGQTMKIWQVHCALSTKHTPVQRLIDVCLLHLPPFLPHLLHLLHRCEVRMLTGQLASLCAAGAGRLLLQQPLQHLPTAPLRSCRADAFPPGAGRVLGPQPPQHIDISPNRCLLAHIAVPGAGGVEAS
ncbi:hypothetical protein B484DRAFT_130474 [Ochromonadaceae sp. CCMP2298]|nr:hypothetical protein B484DRAFT_130474 [Ochromonadaceae sp. CCMP2298]